MKAIVIGTSAGGLHSLRYLLEKIPSDFKIPVLVAQHVSADSDNTWIQNLARITQLNVKEGEEKEFIEKGVYIAPSDYHMLVDYGETITLSKDEKVNYSRPSIDVLFESASDVYTKSLIGIILTGSSGDGAKGLLKVKEKGGIAIVQSPEEAEYPLMPETAIKISGTKHILTLEEIISFLLQYNY